MCDSKGLSLSATVCVLLVLAQATFSSAQSLTTLNGPQGGTIVYGQVAGATSPASAMAKVLRNVQNGCGEKPQVGKVFRAKGSNSDAVFFTVTNRAQGNVPVAGLLIATQTGPQTVEAAMVSDAAARFSSSINPMLQQLFGVWPPGGAAAPTGKASAPAAAAGGNVAIPPMRQFTLPDGTATVSLPAGWNVVPNQSGMAITTITGPQGAMLQLNAYYVIYDLNNPQVQQRMRMRVIFQNEIDIPNNVDLTKYFADILQRIRAAYGQGPAPLKLDSVQPVSGSQGQCVTATGQFNPDNTTMRDMSMLLCRSTPNQSGLYFLTYNKCLLPLGVSDQERATANAIMASYKPDMQRAQAIANAQAAPIIAQMQQTYQAHTQALMSFTQSQIARTQQIGAQATARMQSTEAANQQEWSNFDQQESNISRQGQGFSNYLLDQSVVQNNNVGGTGMVGHATMWNTQANALVQANPNKYEFVPEQNYWAGTDFQP